MKKIALGVVVVGVVVAAAWAVMNYPPKGAGQATGSAVKPKKAPPVQMAMWEELAKYESSYLGSYAEYFQNKPDEPMELLNAFNELAYSVTGPGGLWRKKVPDKYFGCSANDDLPICGKFKQVERTFSQWDKLQQEMMDIDNNKQAQKFLTDHAKEMEEYIRTFVPSDESFSAIQSTKFFADNLASSM